MLPGGKLALITGGGSGIGEDIACAMAEQGARVIVSDRIAAGATRVADARRNADYMDNFTRRIPLGRLGEPADIAGPTVFLASDLARCVTGVTLPADGGFLPCQR